MNFMSWEEYHEANGYECSQFPQVSQEYIYTYPLKWASIDVLDVWGTHVEAWFPKHYSIYIHFPFCKEMCPFCTFCHIPWNEELARAYVECLEKEMIVYAKHPSFRSISIDSIYFGGGTPCLIPNGLLDELLRIIFQEYSTRSDIEITVECNPNDVSLKVLDHAAAVGVNRISFGVQSLQKKLTKVLRIRNRHAASVKALKLARDVGFAKVSVDLMYGIPSQGAYNLIDDIDNCVDLGATALSLYWLDVKGSKLEEAVSFIPTPEAAKEVYYSGREHLLKCGFKQQTQPDFFKDERCTFVDIAWRGPQGGTIGFGAGAITFFFNGWTYVNVNDVRNYLKLLEEDRLPVLGGMRITQEDLMGKYPILGFRCLVVPVDPFERTFGTSFSSYFHSELNHLQDLELVSQNGGGFKLTEKGLWYVDNVSREFYVKDNEKLGQPWAKLLERVEIVPTRNIHELPVSNV